MRFAILLGIIIIALPLLLRVGTADPWPDAESYAVAAQGFPAFIADSIPLQVLLIIAAVTFLTILGVRTQSESFVVFLATSPAFIVLFTSVSVGVIGAVIIAAGSLLLQRKHHWAVAFIPVAFALDTNVGILASMMFIVIAIMQGLPFIALGVSFFALVSSIILTVSTTAHGIQFISPAAVWTDILLGGHGGITLFMLVLGLMGFLIQYRNTKQAVTFLPLALIVLAPFFTYGNIVIAMVLAYTGSETWEYLRTREWRFEELQSITLVLIACSILFTTILTVRERADVDEDLVQLRQFMNVAMPRENSIAVDANIAGALVADGFVVGTPDLPPDPSFIANALTEQGYAYIVTRGSEAPYAHFPVLFMTTSTETYTIYEVPQR